MTDANYKGTRETAINTIATRLIKRNGLPTGVPTEHVIANVRELLRTYDTGFVVSLCIEPDDELFMAEMTAVGTRVLFAAEIKRHKKWSNLWWWIVIIAGMWALIDFLFH